MNCFYLFRGHCHINAAVDEEELKEAIATVLKESPIPHAEEYAIHDYEGFYGVVSIREYESLSTVTELARFIEEYGELGALLLDFCSNEVDTARRTLEEDYRGSYRSLSEFAEELTEETTTIPDAIRYYIDYDHMASDMELSGDIFSLETRDHLIHVFWSR